jgi:GNAT superfamily N-acetyltransferase
MTEREPIDVQIAGAAEKRSVIDTIVLAFAADPIIRWLFPDPSTFRNDFPEFVDAYGGNAFEHGGAYFVEDFAAGALWLPPNVHPDEEALVDLFRTSVPEERQAAAFEALEALDGFHPEAPFWHLPLIGTDPTEQRKGYGSALLRHALEICDREGTIAYLESTNPENLSLYVRYGFEVLGTVQVGEMASLFPMRREPI